MSIIKKLRDFKRSFISNHGVNNHVFVVNPDGTRHEVRRLKHSHIKFSGNNNTIEIHMPCNNLMLNVNVCNNTSIVLFPSSYPRKISIAGFKNDGNKIVFGRDLSTTDVLQISLLRGPGDIIIGSDCMFAYKDIIQLGDGHAIYDNDTGNVINNNKNIIIDNHVWITADVLLLKGCHIPNNCIVGTKSVVTKKFEDENAVIVGNTVVKKNIHWTRESQY